MHTIDPTFEATHSHTTTVFGAITRDGKIWMNEDNTRTLDLDKIYENIEMKNDEGVYSPRHGSSIKLAVNPRWFNGMDETPTLLHDFLSFGSWDKGTSHRLNSQMLDGPQAFTYHLAVTIHSHAYTQEFAFLLEEGDHLIIRGVEYIATQVKSYPKLNPIKK